MKEKMFMWKTIWTFRYRILLFLLLCIVSIPGIYKMLFFIPESWGSYENGEFTPAREYLSFVLGLIFSGFVLYNYYTMKEENYYLKKIVHLFYSLNPKAKKEIMKYYAHTDPHPLISEVIRHDYLREHQVDRFIEGKDAAMFLLIEKSISPIEESNILPYLRKATQSLDENPLFLKLRKVESIISSLIPEDVQKKCETVFYNLKSNIMNLFLCKTFLEYEIREEVKGIEVKEDKIILDFVEVVIDYYFKAEQRKYIDMQIFYSYITKKEKELNQ